MPSANLATRLFPAALLLVTLGGCLSAPPGTRYLSDANRNASQPAAAGADQTSASNLRIPVVSDARQSAGDVPVVPVPPVPTGTGATLPVGSRPTPQPTILPVAGFAPAPSPPVVATTASSARELIQQAAAAYANMDSYIARLTRREMVNGKNDEEVMLFKFRKEPWSVYFKWLGDTGKGREVVFVKGQHDSQIHTLLAAGDHPLKSAGSRIALAPDSVFVRRASRHPITEAGIGASVERLVILETALERGDTRRGTLSDLGTQRRPDYSGPLAIIEHTFPPGFDASLPRGGKRIYGFDPENHLPVLVTAMDDKGQEVEYYRYDRLQFPVRLDNDDFDPDKLWARPTATRAVRP